MAADDDLDTLLTDLVGVLRELERDLEPETVAGVPRPPTPRELARFTSEVAIPGAILVLRANIETLRLLQRTLRMADGRESTGTATLAAVGDRARSVSRATLARLDETLVDLQAAMAGRPEDEEARALLDRARALQDEVDTRLAGTGVSDDTVEAESVPVDVEAELQSIRRAIEDETGGDGTGAPGDSGAPEPPGSGAGAGGGDGGDGADDES